jgi:hypothetical protein
VVTESSTVSLIDCYFRNNTANNGAVLDASRRSDNGAVSTVLVDGCTFEDNEVRAEFGGILNVDKTQTEVVANSVFTVANSVFTENVYPANGADIVHGLGGEYFPFSCTNTCAVTLVADQCKCGASWPVRFKAAPHKATLTARAGTARTLKLRVTNTGSEPIVAADDATLTLTADDGLSLLKSSISPAIKEAHNKSTHVKASEWTWPVVLGTKKTRTYRVRVGIDACTTATALTVASAVGLTVGPTFTINIKPALAKAKATCP